MAVRILPAVTTAIPHEVHAGKQVLAQIEVRCNARIQYSDYNSSSSTRRMCFLDAKVVKMSLQLTDLTDVRLGRTDQRVARCWRGDYCEQQSYPHGPIV